DRSVKEIILPNVEKFVEETPRPGTIGSSSMRRAGLYLKDVVLLNSKNANFRFFSPDETYSNKLDAMFEVTKRSFVWPIKEWDKDLAPDGRVIEMLSEHSLQGLIQGYVLTGRHAIFASYEAFIQVVSSMADQYSKFLHAAREIPWRGKIPSLNYILTSSGWRQEHNGFSHQNPGFINTLLEKHGCFIHVYFPPDGTSTLAVLEQCMKSKSEINVIVAGKTLEPRWLTLPEAKKALVQGLMTWDFASDEDPDIVLSGVGDYLTKEVLATIDLVKTEAPEIKMRFVNIMELSALGIGNSECRIPIDFSEFFTKDKPVIFNFHGYPETLKQVLFDFENALDRFSVHGYVENGSTTTPFDMQIRNKTSRWHLAMEVFERMAKAGVISKEKAKSLIEKYTAKLAEHREYIIKNGIDPEEIENWKWTR
ncbi:MAG: phosphoketolase family protein, partial [Candidatus Pacebacteria bacterium]|nr:phosphoketolase family protein [Candidatus Paceibacterota bacterium]